MARWRGVTRAATSVICAAALGACGGKTSLLTPEDEGYVSNGSPGGIGTPIDPGDEPRFGGGGGDDPINPGSPGQPGGRPGGGGGGSTPGNPGRPIQPPTDPDFPGLPPEVSDELCRNICASAAHPCRGNQDFGQCFDQCFFMAVESAYCPPVQDLLFCFEAISFEVDPCNGDIDQILTEECSGTIQEVLRACPEFISEDLGPNRPIRPPPVDELICNEVTGSFSDSSCYVEAFDCNDGGYYGVDCFLSGGSVSCECFSDFGGAGSGFGFGFPGGSSIDFQEFCQLEALMSCGFPIYY